MESDIWRPAPTKEDVAKLHAEIGLMLNHRFVLTTLAVTIFAAMGAWLIPKEVKSLEGRVGGFLCGVSCVLSALLFLLFWLSHRIKAQVKLYATYLILTGASNWEKHWQAYQRARPITNRATPFGRPEAALFVFMTVVSGLFPSGLAAVLPLKAEPVIGLWLCGLLGVAAATLIVAMNFFEWRAKEPIMEQRWAEVLGRFAGADATRTIEIPGVGQRAPWLQRILHEADRALLRSA